MTHVYIGREAGDGSAQRGRSVIYDCVVAHTHRRSALRQRQTFPTAPDLQMWGTLFNTRVDRGAVAVTAFLFHLSAVWRCPSKAVHSDGQ